MKFQRIEIENFSSYYGKNEPIYLNTTKEKPLVIFIGGTGFGKTSIFDAINWALYGEAYEKDLEVHKERKITDYINESALKEAINFNKRVQMSVTLYFEHEGLENSCITIGEYYITQGLNLKPYRNSKGEIKFEQTNRVTCLREIKPSGDHVEIPYTRTFLDEILPNNVKSYFLFDGDRIHNLAKPGNSQEVQDAIYRVVDLEILRNASEHLLDAASEFGKKAANSAIGELATIETKYSEELDFLNNLKTRIGEIKKERQSIKDQIERIDEKLRDLPETKALQEKKNNLRKELLSNDQLQKEVKNRLRENAAKASLGIVAIQINRLRDLLHEKRTKGEIPKHIRETFFNDLFKIEKCICGTAFKAEVGDPIYENLKKRLMEEKLRSKEEDILVDLYHQLNQADSIIVTARKDVEFDDNLLIELEKEEKSLIYQIQEIDQQLKDLPTEDINILVTERNNREDRDKDLVAELTTKRIQLDESEKKLKELDDKRTEVSKKHEESQSFHLRSKLAKESADILDELYETFAEQSRKDVERLTIEEFKKFVISASNYQVALSKDYSLDVLDSNGNKALQRLSMGQSQCLSLAFITAISRVSKKNPPLVIDMPFSRLDSNVHDAISKRLPGLSSQTILFLIPGVEWNSTTRSNLINHARYIYEMHFDESLRQTTISMEN